MTGGLTLVSVGRYQDSLGIKMAAGSRGLARRVLLFHSLLSVLLVDFAT